jgi:redox-sensitive bicupin YhaK (pirin superfamily)
MRHDVRLKTMEHGAQFRAFILRDNDRTGALDPILGVDHAWMAGPTFPSHSHVGFSAVSYVFADAETGLKNEDSIGTRNLIRPGGLHWTAAGAGIVHEEVPADDGKVAHLLQIFVNLPPSKQAAAPYALSLEPNDVPIVNMPGALIRVPLGAFGGATSPLTPPTKIRLLDITLDEAATLSIPVAARENAFIIPVKGTVAVDGTDYDANAALASAFSATTTGRTLAFSAPNGVAQFVVFSGIPAQDQD